MNAPGDARAEAYSIVQRFPASPRREMRMDRHYLLYAASGTVRLEADGKVWTLPPARAAMIAAGEPIQVTLPTDVRACSVLFDVGFIAPPAAPLTVVTMTPLARELALACGTWIATDVPLTPYPRQLFLTLAAVVRELAITPSRAVMPIPRSPGLTRALDLTEERMAEPLRFDEVAKAAGMTPRSLARRFEAEMGMTWRMALRRLRVIAALDHLAGGATVTQAAFAVGYSSVSAFNAAFQEVMDETPTAFRAAVARQARDAEPGRRRAEHPWT